MKPLLPLLASLALLLAQCHHADPQPPPDPLSLLPPETQTGARTLGCLVNGQPYATVTSIDCVADFQNANTIALRGDIKKNTDFHGDRFGIEMLLHGPLLNGQTAPQLFKLIPTDSLSNRTNNVFVATGTPLNGSCDYRGRYIRSGLVTLTRFDGVARVVAGRFAFTLYQPGSGCDTLRVTNGRFDIQF